MWLASTTLYGRPHFYGSADKNSQWIMTAAEV